VSHRPPYNYEQAAAASNTSERTVRRAVASGELAATRIGGMVRILPEVLDDWILAHTPDIDDELREFVRRTRAASGVPETVEDPTALAAVGTILTNAAPVQPRRRPRGRRAVE
jgi:excisionase family DNA binding protein